MMRPVDVNFEDWRIRCGVEVTESSTNKQHSLYLDVVIGDSAFFNKMALFLHRFSFRTQLYWPFFNAALETPSPPCLGRNWHGAA
jgi:hypothetical protein